jgi:hypothetical protein
VYGAALDFCDLVGTRHVGDANRGQLLAFFGEYLDARVEAVEVIHVIRDFFAVEVDGCGSGGFRVGGHLEFFIRGRLELGLDKKRRCQEKNPERAKTTTNLLGQAQGGLSASLHSTQDAGIAGCFIILNWNISMPEH